MFIISKYTFKSMVTLLVVVFMQFSCKKEKMEITCKSGFSSVDFEYHVITLTLNEGASLPHNEKSFIITTESDFQEYGQKFKDHCFPEKIDFSNNFLFVIEGDHFGPVSNCDLQQENNVVGKTFSEICHLEGRVDIKVFIDRQNHLWISPVGGVSHFYIFIISKEFEEFDFSYKLYSYTN